MTGQVHLVLQDKGGLGKSLVAAMLVQHIRSNDQAVKAYDTGPIDASLSTNKSLKAEQLVLIADGTNEIDKSVFDSLMEGIIEGARKFRDRHWST
jgi:CO dehydrogenase nickel-insertion accessory protein CooC1